MPGVPTRTRAIRILEDGHRRVHALARQLSSADLRRSATIGDGDWSAKDLLGHLTSWDEHGLAALAAWREGEPAPIQRALRAEGLNAINAAAVEADARRSAPVVLRRFDSVHARLIAEIRGLASRAWSAPPTTRSRTSLGAALGGILGGPAGRFTHAQAHLGDLEEYVRSRKG